MSGFIAPALRIIIMQFIAHNLTRTYSWQLLVLLLADGLLFCGTNARNVASYVVVIGFILLMATLYQLLYGLLTVMKPYGIPLKHRRRLTVSLISLASGLVALQSIGELSVRDVLVIMPLAVLVYLYSFYGAGSQDRRLS